MRCLDFFMQRMIKNRLQLGSRTSTDSLMSSPCVESVLTWLPLIAFQAELAVSIRGAISDIHHDVSKIREEVGGQLRPVSTNFIRPIGDGKMLTAPRFKLGQQHQLPREPASYTYI